MRRHEGRIDPTYLEQGKEPLHAQAPSGAEPGLDRLLGHADAPVEAGNGHEVAMAVVADIGDRAAGLGDLDGVLECDLAAQRLDCRVDADTAGDLEDSLNWIDGSGIDDHIGAIEAGQLLPGGNGLDGNDQSG